MGNKVTKSCLRGTDRDDITALTENTGSSGEDNNFADSTDRPSSSSSENPHRAVEIGREAHLVTSSSGGRQRARRVVSLSTAPNTLPLNVTPLSQSSWRSQSTSAMEGSGDSAKSARKIFLLNKIPITKYQPPSADAQLEDNDAECMICMDEFEAGCAMRALPCGHGLHESCADQWLLKSFTCPYCGVGVDAGLLAEFPTSDLGELGQLSSSPAYTAAASSRRARSPTGVPGVAHGEASSSVNAAIRAALAAKDGEQEPKSEDRLQPHFTTAPPEAPLCTLPCESAEALSEPSNCAESQTDCQDNNHTDRDSKEM